eukprot:CAMPEP_0201506902 /NCGR_PEP_ID=MMETSP0161_2-20130828/735_1 /ASSEMBLY_ACC=CAM_ASM_000251 /TAXON_ID=180227 /ORGANISM="Neoparamoeba aestuarina, Strain SoJaBio B1-5/56/2" /LENGTH=911 /DNA_ID=CAMNT_0047901141 /DNA_START=111 /DNA_END=2846 /DNA_ORIENTATION=-
MGRMDAELFRMKVDEALEKVKTILENNKSPEIASDVHHKYDDKFLLAEMLTNLSSASMLAVLLSFGLKADGLQKIYGWVNDKKRSVSLRLEAIEKCSFIKKVVRKEDSKVKVVTSVSTPVGLGGKFTSKDVYEITEYLWKFEFSYELNAYVGNSPHDKIVLNTRKGTYTITSGSEYSPKPDRNIRPNIDVNITWLFQHMNDKQQFNFTIDRTKSTCHTPTRNRDSDAAIAFFIRFGSWCSQVQGYFSSTLFPVQTGHALDLAAINADGIFLPVLPLFESNPAAQNPSSSSSSSSSSSAPSSSEVVLVNGPSSVIPLSYIPSFLAEQQRSFDEKYAALEKVFPQDKDIITSHEAKLMASCLYAITIGKALSDGISYIEEMLYEQLCSAVGKVVTPADFGQYMTFHNRKLFRDAYTPSPFSFPVQRPDHTPEGVLSIESQDGGEMCDPIITIRSEKPAHCPVEFSIDAATKIKFYGERHLHAFISHQFSGSTFGGLNLIARTRQFSSFILVVGQIISSTEFEPRHAIIVQNKDEVLIPLLLEKIPAAQGGKDALESLSPEQQRFVKAFRSMQLESTLLGVLVIQIKPQLERLLNLPSDGLTKEIALTQKLMKLFIEYQIPSDMLSYDGEEDAPLRDQLAKVKEYVKRMEDMIERTKGKQLADAKQRQEYRKAQSDYVQTTVVSVTSTFSNFFGGGSSTQKGGHLAGGKSGSVGGVSGGPAGGADESPVSPQEKESHFDLEQSDEDEPDCLRTSFGEVVGEEVDYTQIPVEVDKRLATLGRENAMRPTIIHLSNDWTKKSQRTLLSKPTQASFPVDDQRVARNSAFDLLDALTKSGELSIRDAQLHVIMASTHYFDKSLVDTIVQDSINPIEKLEKTTLMVAGIVHNKRIEELVRPEQVKRLREDTAIDFDGDF